VDRVSAVRAFNRLWSTRIGVLDAKHLDTPFSLAEARTLFELAQEPAIAVGALRSALDLDAGYLSRILARFKRDGLVTIERAPDDARKQVAKLTAAGKRAFRTLDRRSSRLVEALLTSLPEDAQSKLVASTRAIAEILERPRASTVLLRGPHAGDLGWIVERHGALYAREYAWNEEFEALVAKIVAEYAQHHDPKREAVWIAEVDGARAGCVMCVQKSASTAQLRLLLVEPTARGHGLGARLVDECIRFARERGYKKLVLWTNDILHSARKIYEAAGFTLAHSAKHHAFGHSLVEQTWALRL
jgi:DNA-binding MarR family transcriptional regulator/N-acetylglutamate synthase-like GNAT family acetyltransferase